ncbi:hypothetical protein DJ527_05180 [Sulfolobus sp. F1]|nr:hypothetical protein DJ527_05180 [Sulfolobus sp. F1]
MRRKVRKSKIKVLIVGGLTIDEINGNNKPGGSLIYSSLGVLRAGGVPSLYGLIGKDLDLKQLNFISDFEKYFLIDDYTIKFRILLMPNINKSLVLLRKPKVQISNLGNINADGVIVNPVCKEVDLNNLNTSLPVALDIQGLIRNCIENEYIKYESDVKIPYNKNYMIIHLNYEEFTSSKLTLDSLFKTGFKEVIISDGYNGFVVYTNTGESHTFKPSKIGNNNVGNGDFLLGSYFTLRLSGLNISQATEIAGKLTEEFSSSEFSLSFQ